MRLDYHAPYVSIVFLRKTSSTTNIFLFYPFQFLLGMPWSTDHTYFSPKVSLEVKSPEIRRHITFFVNNICYITLSYQYIYTPFVWNNESKVSLLLRNSNSGCRDLTRYRCIYTIEYVSFHFQI